MTNKVKGIAVDMFGVELKVGDVLKFASSLYTIKEIRNDKPNRIHLIGRHGTIVSDALSTLLSLHKRERNLSDNDPLNLLEIKIVMSKGKYIVHTNGSKLFVGMKIKCLIDEGNYLSKDKIYIIERITDSTDIIDSYVTVKDNFDTLVALSLDEFVPEGGGASTLRDNDPLNLLSIT